MAELDQASSSPSFRKLHTKFATRRIRARSSCAHRPILADVPLTFEIDPQLSLIAITRSHNPTFDEWRAFMEGLLSDARFRPGQAIIEDRRADRSVPTRNDVETAAAWVRTNAARLGQIRWAVVLDPAALAAFGMVRVGEFLTDRSGVALRAFTSIETARAWVAAGAATGA